MAHALYFKYVFFAGTDGCISQVCLLYIVVINGFETDLSCSRLLHSTRCKNPLQKCLFLVEENCKSLK